MYRITFAAAALAAMQRHLSAKDQAALAAKLEAFAADPFAPRGSVKRLTGSPFWRMRQGDYRAVLEVDSTAKTVHVRDFDHRSRVYR